MVHPNQRNYGEGAGENSPQPEKIVKEGVHFEARSRKKIF